jgi:hypothetical protein
VLFSLTKKERRSMKTIKIFVKIRLYPLIADTPQKSFVKAVASYE